MSPRGLCTGWSPASRSLDAALTEPNPWSCAALEKVNAPPAERTLVIGDGTIALLAAHLAAQWSPAEIVLARPPPGAGELALASGATSFIVEDDESLTGAFDLVVEAAGATRATSARSPRCAAEGASCCSGFRRPVGLLELPADLLVNNDLTVARASATPPVPGPVSCPLLNTGRITARARS